MKLYKRRLLLLLIQGFIHIMTCPFHQPPLAQVVANASTKWQMQGTLFVCSHTQSCLSSQSLPFLYLVWGSAIRAISYAGLQRRGIAKNAMLVWVSHVVLHANDWILACRAC